MLEGDFPDDASQPEPGLDGARPTGTWIDEYGGVPEGSNMLSWLEEDDLPPLPPFYCDKCNTLLSEPDDGGPIRNTTEKPCRVGNCWVFACKNCGWEYGGFGPVCCPCQDRDPKIRRIRVQYRRRKK